MNAEIAVWSRVSKFGIFSNDNIAAELFVSRSMPRSRFK